MAVPNPCGNDWKLTVAKFASVWKVARGHLSEDRSTLSPPTRFLASINRVHNDHHKPIAARARVASVSPPERAGICSGPKLGATAAQQAAIRVSPRDANLARISRD